MTPVHRSWLASGLAAGLAIVGLGAPASAAPDPSGEPGLWYYFLPQVDQAHASGITGSGVTIAIIDGPIYLEVPTLQGANIEVQDSFCFDEAGVRAPGTTTDFADQKAGHGTSVTSLIVGTGAGYPGQNGVLGVAPGAKVLSYNGGGEESNFKAACWDAAGNPSSGSLVTAKSIEDAVARGADIISVSLTLSASTALDTAVATALREGVILVASLSNHSGNDVEDLDGAPATQNGVVSVLSLASDGTLQLRPNGKPNTSKYVDVVAPGVGILDQGSVGSGWEAQTIGQGTSFATPIVAGVLALALQKYPDATPNQILQSMIHNTGSSGVSHEPIWDETYGYGTVSARTLLLADPTQYEDVNPFISDDVDLDEGPTVAEIFGAATPTPSTTATPTPSVTIPVEGGGSSLAPIILIGGIALLAIVAVILIIVMIAARKPTEGARHG